MGVQEHRAASSPSVCCAVVTVSDTRTAETDTSGRAIVDLLTAAGHRVLGRWLTRDEPDEVRSVIEHQLANPEVQAIIITGGTGISARDGTHEIVRGLLRKEIPGFGELFRMLSYTEVGPAAMLSRAVAGVAASRLIVSLPGSEAAVRLAMDKLLLPEIAHLVREARR